MSHSPEHFARRRRAALLVPASVLVLLLAAAPASATAPEGWPAVPEVGALDMLLVIVAAPLGLVLLIALLTYLPVMVRGETTAPTDATAIHEWFGGPRSGTRELADPDTARSRAGGASARW